MESHPVRRIKKPTLIAIAWIVWAGGFLGIYYQKLWRLFVVGPVAWVNENEALRTDLVLWRALSRGPETWVFPALREACLRALSGLWGAILILSSALVLGGWLLSALRWRTTEREEALFFRAATGLGIFAYLLAGCAFLGHYRPLSIRLLIILILSTGGIHFVVTKIPRLLEKHRGGIRAWGWRPRSTHPSSPNLMLSKAGNLVGNFPWILVIGAALLIALIGALAPEIEYDALWYHLWLPKLWLQHGGPVDIIEEYISLYPLTWELNYGAGLVLGGAVAAKLLHFTCLPLIALLIARYTRRYIPGVSPWIAASLWITIPTVLWEATTAYVDLALTLHVLAAIYALLKYREEKQGSWLALSGINLGFALATKHLGLFFLLILPVWLALTSWRENHAVRRALVPAVCLASLALCISLPWYLRSWLASGNPVFPELFEIFGAYPPVRWDAITQHALDHFKASFGRPRTLVNLLSLPWDMSLHAARYQGTLGPLFLILLPGLFMRRGLAQSWRVIFGFSLVYLVFWASPLSSFQIRFLVTITPLLALLAVEGYARLADLLHNLVGNNGKRMLQAGLAFLCLLNFPPFTSLHEVDRVGWEGWLTHVMHRIPIEVVAGLESQESYLERNVPSYAAWRYINTQLPTGVRVLTFSGGDHFYSDRGRLWSDATLSRPAVWGAPRGEEAQAFQTLSQLGITHVLFDMDYIGAFPPDTLAITQPEVIEERYRLEYSDTRFRLYSIRSP